MKDKKEISVFIASPGDVTEERNIVRDVCNELNKSPLRRLHNISFEVTGWEDAIPSAGRPQEIINKLVDECDIFVCIFHRKFGSPTGKEESGTLEEFLLAYNSWESTWKHLKIPKPHIMLYFKEVTIHSKKDMDTQLEKVMDLKEKFIDEKSLLFSELKTADKFYDTFKKHLEGWIADNSKNWGVAGEEIKVAFENDKNVEKYLKFVSCDHRYLPMQGFESNVRFPIQIEKVYINMKAFIHSHDFEYTLEGIRRREKKVQEEGWSSLDLKAAFKAAERHKIKDMVILGKPGSGKTTLLKYVLLSLVDGKGVEKLGIEKQLIPFFVPLRELKDPDLESFTDFVKRVCSLSDFSISETVFRKLLDDGQGIILLDGLDEVSNKDIRAKTRTWIDKARKQFSCTWFIITSRYTGYSGTSRFEGGVLELSIQDFTPDEVREFLVRWYEEVEAGLHPTDDEAKRRKEGRDKALNLVDKINKSEYLRKLAVNPLILQIIALVHKDRGTLPQRRVELYNECTNVLLEKWDMARGLQVLLSAREARQILQPVALWLHEKEERRSAPIGEIIKIIKDPLQEIGKSDIDPMELLQNIRDRSGIFMGYSENEYGFTHLGFQEYLSAEQIRNKEKMDVLLSNFGNTWWKEVILLCLALDNPSIIEKFMEKLIPTKNFLDDITLITDAVKDSIVKPLEPFIFAMNNEKLLPEARYNAIRILKEIGGDKVIQALKKAVKSKDTKQALLAYDTLNLLGAAEGGIKPVIEEIITNPIDDSQMTLVPAGTFLYGSREDDPIASSDEKPQRVIDLPSFYIDIFPVTNAQYCKFLNSKMPNEGGLGRWIDLKGSFGKEKFRITRKGNKYEVEKGYEKHPVIYVTWYGANEYSRWAEKRLPTEEEWEKAARGTDGKIYPWGDRFDNTLCNSYGSGIEGITMVDRYPKGKSCYGCYDMAGNVWEWTDSWYEKDETRVVRGGSWYYQGDYCRCANRGRDYPNGRGDVIGFRCARTLKL